MPTSKSLCVVITIVILSPLGHSIMSEFSEKNSPMLTISDTIRDNNWNKLENPISSEYNLEEPTYKIHSPYGSVDPILASLPTGPWQLAGLPSQFDSRLYIVQSNSSDLASLEDILSNLKIEIIDHIPDHSIIISLNSDPSGEIIGQMDRGNAHNVENRYSPNSHSSFRKCAIRPRHHPLSIQFDCGYYEFKT